MDVTRGTLVDLPLFVELNKTGWELGKGQPAGDCPTTIPMSLQFEAVLDGSWVQLYCLFDATKWFYGVLQVLRRTIENTLYFWSIDMVISKWQEYFKIKEVITY